MHVLQRFRFARLKWSRTRTKVLSSRKEKNTTIAGLSSVMDDLNII